MARTLSLGRSGKAASYSARVLGSKSTGWGSITMMIMTRMMIIMIMEMRMMMMELMTGKKHSFQKSSTAKWRRAL